MKIEVTHVIKADERLLTMLDKFIAALEPDEQPIEIKVIGSKSQPATPEKTTPAKAEKVENVAVETMYFVHEGSGEALVVKKGDDLSFLETDIFDQISKSEYDEMQAKQSSEEADPVTHDVTIEMVRAEAAKLTSKGRQADFKALLTSMGSKKLSEVPVEKYPALLEAIKKAVGEA